MIVFKRDSWIEEVFLSPLPKDPKVQAKHHFFKAIGAMQYMVDYFGTNVVREAREACPQLLFKWQPLNSCAHPRTLTALGLDKTLNILPDDPRFIEATGPRYQERLARLVPLHLDEDGVMIVWKRR